MKITEHDIESFRRNGYAPVDGMFDPGALAEIVGWVDELQDWPETPGRHMMYFEQSLDDPPRRILNRMENFSPFHDGMRTFLQGPELLGGTQTLFGEAAVLFKEKINFKLPGGGGFEPHQDVQAGWDDYAKIYITAMVSIDETTVENGCLEMGVWDHRHEMIGNLWEPLTDDQLAGVDFAPCPTKAGDVLFFDSFVPHRSAPNLTATPRRVLYITYNKLSEGDHRERYYADKRKSYPPDCEREPDKEYAYRV
jgi:hypothetical protein